MLPKTRQMWKHVLGYTRIKLLYARITLTRFTTLYFFLSLLSCIVLVIMQGVAYSDNSKAVHRIEVLLSQVNVTKSLPIFSNGFLQMCDSLPGQPGTNCTPVPLSTDSKVDLSLVTREIQELSTSFNGGSQFGGAFESDLEGEVFKRSDEVDEEDEGEEDEEDEDDEEDEEDEEDEGDDKRESASSEVGSSTGVVPAKGQGPYDTSNFVIRDLPCAQTLMWLQDVLEDEKREDVVTIFFNFWLFSVAIVTILNESLPHLGASLAGHILATGWSAYRVESIHELRENYEKVVVTGACGVDFMRDDWKLHESHTIPILVVSAATLFAIAYVSFMLFKVYASQSFSRVGASPQVNRIYKIVLVFSAFLQLTAFFSLASTAMWIDHICYVIAHDMARHRKLYLAAFIITLLLLLPWLALGWISVRKEGRKRFLVFSAMSLFLLTVSAMMFASVLYRFIFMSWSFFATITVTAFVLIVATSILGFWCRLHFGQGLCHFLQASSALDDVDFTPVNFVHDPEKSQAGFPESISYHDEKYSEGKTMPQQPKPTYASLEKGRGQSIYSEADGIPIKLSSTPSLFQERERALSTRRQKKFGGYILNIGSDGYSQPQVPLPSASPTLRSGMSTRRQLSASPLVSVAGLTPTRSTRSATSTFTGLPTRPKLRPSGV